MKTKKIVLFSLLFSGCTLIPSVGPDYEKPESVADEKLPKNFISSVNNFTPETKTAINDISSWWKIFNDIELNTLVDRALTQSYDLRTAFSRVQQAGYQRSIAFSSFLPGIGFQGEVDRSRGSGNAFGPPGFIGQTVTNYRLGFVAQWELDFFGGSRRDFEASLAKFESAEDAFLSTRIAIVSEVTSKYFDLIGLRKRIEASNTSVIAQEESLKLAKEKYDAGLTTELDLLAATTRVGQTKANREELNRQSSLLENEISILLGGYPGEVKVTTDDFRGEIEQLVPSVGIPAEALARRPDVKQAEAELKAATAEIGGAKSEWFPKISIGAGYGRAGIRSYELFDRPSKTWSLIPSIQFPIFAAGKILANVNLQEEEQIEALLKYEQTVKKAINEVENSMISLNREKAAYDELTRVVESSHKATELAKELYKNGLADFQRVLDSQLSEAEIMDRFAASKARLFIYVTMLYRSIGGGYEVASAE